MKILLLVGSGDSKSHSLHLAQTIEAELQQHGAETEVINLVESGLPLYNRQVERDQSYDPITHEFLDKSYAADAFVWVTPIYHNSYSSILKTALDWQHNKLKGTVVGLASHGGHRSPQAADQLILVARAQHIVAIPTRVCTEDGDYDEQLTIVEPIIVERIKSFAQELVTLAKQVKT